MIYTTAQLRLNVDGGLNHLNLQTHSYAELCSDQRPRISFAGFCQNTIHVPRQYSHTAEEYSFCYYEVKGLRGRAYMITTDKSKNFCRCGDALFWARNYKKIEMTPAQEHARNLVK